jgi:hypothetical protein
MDSLALVFVGSDLGRSEPTKSDLDGASACEQRDEQQEKQEQEQELRQEDSATERENQDDDDEQNQHWICLSLGSAPLLAISGRRGE